MFSVSALALGFEVVLSLAGLVKGLDATSMMRSGKGKGKGRDAKHVLSDWKIVRHFMNLSCSPQSALAMGMMVPNR